MGNWHALVIFLAVLAAGLLLFNLCLSFAQRVSHKRISPRSIFKDFRQKMWMTCGLGVLFLALYLVVVAVGYFLKDSDLRLDFFFYVYKHPSLFIYLGLLVFACVSTSIYLARMVIKHLYNTRK